MRQVLFGEQSVGTLSVGTIELARPEAHNALTKEMLLAIEKRLQEWAADPKIACVFMHSENPKAFCSGGDVKALAAARLAGDGAGELAKEFFTQEYFTDYFIHTYPKPIVAWLDGICMGGGIGLTAGASHRVVTEKTVMAMPETLIGFFPDVGATKFLNGLCGDLGIYLGLTGRKFSGSTGVAIGMVDHLLVSSSKRQVMADIARMPWKGNNAYDRHILTEYFDEVSVDKFKVKDGPENGLVGDWSKLEKIFARGDFAEIVKAIPQVMPSGDRRASAEALLPSAYASGFLSFSTTE